MIHITSHEELLPYIEKKDLRNLDLSGLDLSSYPPSTWEDCMFENTNLANTKINLDISITKKYKRYDWEKEPSTPKFIDCDFTNVDLSKIPRKCWENVQITGSTFTNTGINLYLEFNVDLAGVTLDENNPLTKEEIEEYCLKLNFETLEKNPWLTISSHYLGKLIQEELKKDKFITPEQIKSLLEKVKYYLSFDKEGYLVKFYLAIKEGLTPESTIRFFQGKVENVHFSNITLPPLPEKLLEIYEFENCTFDTLTSLDSIATLTKFSSNSDILFSKQNTIHQLILPALSPSSWQKFDMKTTFHNRIGSTSYTFHTSVYVELSRDCPGKCSFCRNQTFPHVPYQEDKVIDSFTKVLPHANDIIIGGGEPTLKISPILKMIEIKKRLNYFLPNLIIFTNGIVTPDEVISLLPDFHFNISRHAISDEENARIFKLPPNRLLRIVHLANFVNDKITLTPTLFEGGLDTASKIFQYIDVFSNMGYENILFQMLHKDASLGTIQSQNMPNPIDQSEIDKVKDYLLRIGFIPSPPIYSTGGYCLTIYKYHGLKISIKEYIPENQMENWYNAKKRTFDISIDPSGNIYENWNQQSEPVLHLKK